MRVQARRGAIASVLVTAMLSAGCASGVSSSNSPANAAQKTFTIKYSSSTALPEPNNQAIQKFKELVEAASHGRIKVQPYYNGVLGNASQQVSLVQSNVAQMSFTNVALLSTYLPKYNFLQLPMIFNDRKTVADGLKSAAMQGVNDEFRTKTGVRVVAWQELGFVQLLNRTHAVAQPSDLHGLKIRIIPGSKPLQQSMQLFGAQPVPLDFTELFTALQQGTIDGNEEPLPIFKSDKEYEVSKNLTLLNFQYNPAPVLINEKFYQSLPADLRAIVDKCAAEAASYELDVAQKQADDDLAFMKGAGVKVTEPSADQRDAFVSAVRPLIDSARSEYGAELFDAFGVR